ncbi:MAG: hypothetical protein ABIA77_04565, partial [Candidatus Omnitrophota bacterium]
MRGVIYWSRRRRFLIVALVLSTVWFFYFQQLHLVKRIAEDKVSEFLGNRLRVRIESISGGFFQDMILQNVEFYAVETGEGNVFRMERVEISYRVWELLQEKAGFIDAGGRSLRYIALYFSRENPFVRGFVKLNRYPDRVELFGNISPVLFGEYGKRGIKGAFKKNDDGKYGCDILWAGASKLEGELDPSARRVDLGFFPVGDKKGICKIEGRIDEDGSIEVYSRMDKVNMFGTEIIGDLRMSYKNTELVIFSVKAENLMIDKRPFWDVAVEGGYFPERKMLFFDDISVGGSVRAEGNVKFSGDYPVAMRVLFKKLDLAEFAEKMGYTKNDISGTLDGDMTVRGVLDTASVKGRVYVGEGALGAMEFRSMFATLEGELPVVRVEDARIITEGGQ